MSRRSSGQPPKSERPRRGASKPGERRLLASNRKARHDYEIEAVIEAGLALLGSEVKSLRTNGATIAEGYGRIEADELWLQGVHIPPLPQASYRNHDPVRRRKCLVHRRELAKLRARLEQEGRTLVPLSLYFLGPRVKVELGVGRGRRKGDKRQAEREKEDRRRIRSFSPRSE
jgi:SsrA-binding protein